MFCLQKCAYRTSTPTSLPIMDQFTNAKPAQQSTETDP
jgi:hypothetical protein